MDLLGDFLLFELGGFVLGTAALVVFKILTRDINTSRLLDDKDGLMSPERVQALIISVGAAVYILGVVATEVVTEVKALPTIPENVILLIFASQLGYLGFKGKSVLFGR